MSLSHSIKELNSNGFSVIDNVYSSIEINSIIKTIESYNSIDKSSNQTKDLYAIRALIKHIPKCKNLIFNNKLKHIISHILSEDYFISKSIYFDKTANSNWFVPFHQDLSISVKSKHNLKGYNNWTRKQEITGVLPPLKY